MQYPPEIQKTLPYLFTLPQQRTSSLLGNEKEVKHEDKFKPPTIWHFVELKCTLNTQRQTSIEIKSHVESLQYDFLCLEIWINVQAWNC